MADVITEEMYCDSLLELEVRRCFETPGHRVCIIADCDAERNSILVDVIFLIHKIRAEKHIGKVSQYHTFRRTDRSISFPNGGYIDIRTPAELHFRNYYHSVLLCPDVTSFVERYMENFLFPSFGTIARMKPQSLPEPCAEEAIYMFLGINPKELKENKND